MLAIVSADKQKVCMYKGVSYIVFTDVDTKRDFIDVDGKQMFLDKNGKVHTRQAGTENCKTALKSFEDAKVVRDYFIERGEWNYCLLFVLNINTARRIGDLLFANWEDFFDKNGKVKQYWDVKFKGKNGYRMSGEQKTGKKAKVYLNEPTREALQFYIRKEGIDPIKCASQKVFLRLHGNYKGRVISEEAYRVALKGVGNLLGYDVTSHTFRRTWGAFVLSMNPHDPKAYPMVSKVFNHSNLDTTANYIGEVEELKKKYFNDFGNAFQDYAIDGKEVPFDVLHPVSVYDNRQLRDYMLDAFKKIHENAQETDPFKMMELYNTLLEGLESIAKN